MESLILSFNAVAPIFLMMMLGYLMRRVGIAQKKDFDMVNTLVFKIFLPILLFDNLYTTSNIENFSASIVLFTAIGIGLVFVLHTYNVLLDICTQFIELILIERSNKWLLE